jgi:PAS domain S-box-containing protein
LTLTRLTRLAALATNWQWRWGLRERVSVVLGALLVAATVILSLLLASHAQRTHVALAQDNLDALSSQMARELSHGMDRFAREVQLQVRRSNFSQPESTPAQMRRELEEIQQIYPEFAHISIIDVASAKVIAATGGIFEGGDAAGRPVFEEGQKGLFVGDVHDAVRLAGLLPRPASGEPLRFLDVAAPVMGAEARPIRVFGAHLSWEWTSSVKERVLAPVEARRNVQLLLVDSSGRIVLSPAASAPAGQRLADAMGGAASDATQPWSDGRLYLQSVAPTFATGAFPGLGWRVVARQPMDVALAGADSLRAYFLAGGLVLGLLAGCMGWLLAGRIVRPVLELARDAAALRPGCNLPPAQGPEPLEVAQVRNAFHRIAGDALARAERLMGELDLIYQGAPVGLCVVGPDMRYARVNEVWAGAFGLEPESTAGLTVSQFRAPPALVEAVAKVFDMGTAWAAEISTGAEGSERVWQTVLAPVKGSDGRAAAVSVVATEVTEIRRAERALRLGDERKTQFIAMLAHELRNPLAPVVNALEVLNRRPTEHQAQRMRETMQRHIAHMVRMINDLLDVSRVSLGKVALEWKEVALYEVCRSAAESMRHAVASRRQELSMVVSAAVPAVQGDEVRLEQVVYSLLSNASKFGEEGGQIRLSLTRDGECVRLCIEDDGRGITAEFLPHAFDTFAQADTSLDRSEGGLGIGLALVRSLVELHGGTVQAASAGVGKGSRFDVWLPIERKADRCVSAAQENDR